MPPGSHTGSSPSWQPASPGSSGTGPGSPAPGGEDDKSPVTGDCHAGIWGSRGLQCPRPPDPADNRAYVNGFNGSTWDGWSAIPDGVTYDAPAATTYDGVMYA